MMESLNVLAEGLAHHQAGRLDLAESSYRQVLADDPEQPDGLHLLGVVAHQRGEHGRAAELIARACALRPKEPDYRGNLSEACRAAGDYARAEAEGRAAVAARPDHAAFHNTLGLALQAAGRDAEALPSFDAAVRLDPGFALARNNRGLSLRAVGRLPEALADFRDAARLGASLAPAHSNFGQLLLECRRPEEALRPCEAAVRLRPDRPEGWNNLGNVLRRLGRLEEAIECYRRALALQPDGAMAHNNLGQALQEAGRLDAAAGCYEQALRLDPASGRFHANAADLLREAGREDEAMDACREALRLDPCAAETHQLLGTLLAARGDGGGAEAAFREAARLRPDHAESRVGLGRLAEECGLLGDAEASYREALRIDPRSTSALAALATALRGRLPDVDVASAEQLLAGPLPAAARAALEAGLAHALDGRGRYAEAARLTGRANAHRREQLQRLGRSYAPDAHAGQVDRLIAAHPTGWFERARGWGLDSDLPVFVVGLPRSGTTLTEQILASHPRVHGAGELRLVPDAAAALGDRPDAAAVRAAAAAHVRHLRALAPAAERVVDKLPDNYLHLGLIVTLFPRARLIHCRRDGRDVGLSCWMTRFEHIPWACDQQHIAARIREHDRLMAHWRRALAVPPLEVVYEETVSDLEAAARRLLAWCRLDWDPACLKFYEGRRTVRTASLAQVRRPISTTSVGRWRHYAAALAPLLEGLGPPPGEAGVEGDLRTVTPEYTGGCLGRGGVAREDEF